jgi:hypothetical protein
MSSIKINQIEKIYLIPFFVSVKELKFDKRDKFADIRRDFFRDKFCGNFLV